MRHGADFAIHRFFVLVKAVLNNAVLRMAKKLYGLGDYVPFRVTSQKMVVNPKRASPYMS